MTTPFRTNFRYWDDLDDRARNSVARQFNVIVLTGRQRDYVYDVEASGRVGMVKNIAAAARYGELPT